MTDRDSALAARILAALDGAPEPLAAETIRETLAGAIGLHASPDRVRAALESLLTAGRVERVWHGAAARYRVLQNDPAIHSGHSNA